ncbi:STAS domain-containing protein [Chitinophaga defluvii]|uniref:STAS domain-containing protein n=1 Tax=Chitinophaga defluvii TaxID=3163343 RepID=A0ABV2TGG5_9BACT
MKFKIDTKEKIVVFTPQETVLDANLSDAFVEIITHLKELKERNLILDMQLVKEMSPETVKAILTVYQRLYDNSHSCAITHLNSSLTQILKEAGDDMLNIAPTLSEAIDLIMMEELERELMRDEE